MLTVYHLRLPSSYSAHNRHFDLGAVIYNGVEGLLNGGLNNVATFASKCLTRPKLSIRPLTTCSQGKPGSGNI